MPLFPSETNPATRVQNLDKADYVASYCHLPYSEESETYRTRQFSSIYTKFNYDAHVPIKYAFDDGFW